MLTSNQKDFLNKIDIKKKAQIFPYEPKIKQLGESIVKMIKSSFPKARVLFIGSVALEIAGQKDIDIYILDRHIEHNKYIAGLIKLFGKPVKGKQYFERLFIEWRLKIDDVEIEIYLTEEPHDQIKVYKALKSNPALLKEYESIKLRFNGKRYKEYQKAKYEFYNKILTNEIL